MGISLNDFYLMVPRSFQNYYEGYFKAEQANFRLSWEQTRSIAFFSAVGHLKKGTGPRQLIKFPWDHQGDDFENSEKKLPTPEELKAAREYWAKIDKQRGESNS